MELKVKKSFVKIIGLIVILGVVIIFFVPRINLNKPSNKSREKKFTLAPPTPTPNITNLILNYPMSASEGGRSSYRDMIKARGKQTSTLTVTNCKLNPEIIIISKTSSITIINKDKEDHDVTLSMGNTFTIPQHDSQTISLDFMNGAGLYPIHCGNTQDAQGILFLTP